MSVNTPKQMEVGFVNKSFTGEVGHPDRPTDRPGYVPHLGGGASTTGQSFCSCDLALLFTAQQFSGNRAVAVWAVTHCVM